MAKLTRVFAVAAFVLGLGLAAAQSTSAQTAADGGNGGEDPVNETFLVNLFVQANDADVDQDNDNSQNAANVIAVVQSANCAAGDDADDNDCVNAQYSNVEATQVIVQEQDVFQANVSDIDQDNFAAGVDQAIDDDDDDAAE